VRGEHALDPAADEGRGAGEPLATYTRLGVVLVPLTLVATVALSSWV
jgi:hypothetical protein